MAEPIPIHEDFERTYKAHYRRVLGLCGFLLNSPDAAEDAAQEVFLKARRNLSTYDPSRPLSTWLLTIASNHCIDLLRRKRTERRLFEARPSDALPYASGGPSPLAELLAAERGADIRRALGALPDRYRVPLVLAYFNELTYEEIAAALGVGRNTVATLLFRGKQQLRRKLRKEINRGVSD